MEDLEGEKATKVTSINVLEDYVDWEDLKLDVVETR
jgi:hypothetical protein